MKFLSLRSICASVALLGAVTLASSAKAESYALGTLFGSSFGTGTITSTSFTPASFTTLGSGTGAFSTMIAGFPGTMVNWSTNPFTFSSVPTSTSATSTATTGGLLLFSATNNGTTLDFYITQINSVVVGSNSTTGSFYGLGYVTEDGYAVTPDVGFQLTNSGTGGGAEAYSFQLSSPAISPTPEPNSIALLGSGLLGLGGMLKFRSRRQA